MALEDIEIFVKVVEHQNFSTAAHLLRLPKSTVSRRISQLEDRLRIKLLNRTTRRISLTPIGQSYYEKCLGIMERLQDANDMIKGLQAAPRGRLRLSVPHEMGLFFLKDTISDFLKTYPDIAIELEFGNRVVDLVEEGFDVVIRIGKLADSSLTAVKLGVIRKGIYASPEFFKNRDIPHHPSGLPIQECIQFRPTQVESWLFHHETDGAYEVKPKSRIQVNSMQYTCDAAIAGLGIAAISRVIAEPYVAQGKLYELLQDYHLPSIDVYAVYASRRFLSPNIRAFIDFIKPPLSDLLK